jgi:sugar/nucleoside kinase (ribokinase family)
LPPEQPFYRRIAVMPRVLVLGGVSYNLMIYLDAFPAPAPQTVASRGFHETVGSTGAGKALNLGRLGFDVILHGLIGDDFHGGKIREYLAQEPLAFVYDLDPAGTQRHVNLMDARGRRISIFLSYGSPQPPVDQTRLAGLIAQTDYVALNIVNYCRFLIPLVLQAGKPIWCDIHDYDGQNPYHRDFIEAADYVFLSSDALPDYRTFMRRLMAAGKKLVVCTHGADGSTALTPDGRWFETPALADYARRDTNGAGDAFFAGFLHGFAQGAPVERCLRLATIVAGLCVTSPELAAPDLSPAVLAREYARHYGAMPSPSGG